MSSTYVRGLIAGIPAGLMVSLMITGIKQDWEPWRIVLLGVLAVATFVYVIRQEAKDQQQ